MLVYRIAREKWISNLGGSGLPARWNKTGSRVLYTASSLALALLEILVHVDRSEIPSDYMWVSGDVQDAYIEKLESLNCPLILPNPEEIGTWWLQKPGSKLALSVPSVIVPERNFLLNPYHTDFISIRWSEPKHLVVDHRLISLSRPA